MLDDFVLVSGEKSFEFLDNILALREKVWPEYQRLGNDLLKDIYKIYSDFQFLFLDRKNGIVAGVINAIPIKVNQPLQELPDSGLDWVLSSFTGDRNNEVTHCVAISATVNPDYRNYGLSKALLVALKAYSKDCGLNLLVPARPTQFHEYPDASIHDYINWVNEYHDVFDPWLRTHVSLEGEIIKVCSTSRTINASVETWNKWLAKDVLEDPVIEGGLAPLIISTDKKAATYIEPNVWINYEA